MAYTERGDPGRVTAIKTNQHTQHTAIDQALAEFSSWCLAEGVVLPKLKLNEWVRTNCPNKRANNTSLAVIEKHDCILVHDHIRGESMAFPSSRMLNLDDWQAQQQEAVRRKSEEQQRRVRRQKQAAIEIAELWSGSVEVDPFGYMEAKGLRSTHGARWHERRNCWLVPIYDIGGHMVNVQRIYNQKGSNKYFWPGARVVACMMILGELNTDTKRLLIAEGFATCATLSESSGLPVVGSMNAGNLMPVCKAIRSLYARIEVTVCADDDRQTVGNPGRTKALAAATAINAGISYPPLCADCICTDFNDAAQCKRVAP